MVKYSVVKGKRVPTRRRKVKVVKPPTTSQGLKKLANKLSRFTHEKKWYEEINNVTVDSSLPTIIDLSNVGQGGTVSLRDGDNIRIRSVELNYNFEFDDVSTETHAIFRVIIFQWWSNSTPVLGDILNNVTAAGQLQSGYDHVNRYRYRILQDKYHLLVPNSSRSHMLPVRTLLSQFPKRIMTFSGTGTNALDNRLYAMILTDHGVTNAPSMVMYSKFNYSDN